MTDHIRNGNLEAASGRLPRGTAPKTTSKHAGMVAGLDETDLNSATSSLVGVGSATGFNELMRSMGQAKDVPL
jgi:hypothetical protein